MRGLARFVQQLAPEFKRLAFTADRVAQAALESGPTVNSAYSFPYHWTHSLSRAVSGMLSEATCCRVPATRAPVSMPPSLRDSLGTIDLRHAT
jgi:hypothetical protein